MVNSLTPSAIVQLIFLIGQLFFVAYLAHLARQDRKADRQLLESMDRIEMLLTKEAQQRRIIQKVTSH
jgi:hypothetical protein